MTYAAKVILDSVSTAGVRLTTLEITFPRIVLAEFNTHRMLSRNSASSRAIPIPERIKMALESPYVPDEFGSHKKGMQSGDALTGEADAKCRLSWLRARDAAVIEAQMLFELGVHKEYANRLLEPFCWHTVIVTATEWDNYWGLRLHPNATRPIRIVTEMMATVFRTSTPSLVKDGQWHVPYVKDGNELEEEGLDPCKVSVARCARVSYLTHDGKREPAADMALFARLTTAGHMSPLEHVARPAQAGDHGRADVAAGDVYRYEDGAPWQPHELWFGNFKGWMQCRKLVLGEAVFRG